MSLHQRAGDFRFKRDGASDLTIPGVADEGFVQPVVAQDRTGGNANPIYVHETYAHWQGWSLSAPFPADPVGLTRGQSDMPAAPAGLMQVEASFQAASGSLPRLRFGDSYQMRVRTVDLAGNGLDLGGAQVVLDALAAAARPEVFLPISGLQMPYRRFDPIASPVLVLREELTAGEALDVMVIRSNGPTTTTKSYASDLHDPLYHGFNDRHIAPPKSSQRMAERHGRFDAAFGVAGQPQNVFPNSRTRRGLAQRHGHRQHPHRPARGPAQFRTHRRDRRAEHDPARASSHQDRPGEGRHHRIHHPFRGAAAPAVSARPDGGRRRIVRIAGHD